MTTSRRCCFKVPPPSRTDSIGATSMTSRHHSTDGDRTHPTEGRRSGARHVGCAREEQTPGAWAGGRSPARDGLPVTLRVNGATDEPTTGEEPSMNKSELVA